MKKMQVVGHAKDNPPEPQHLVDGAKSMLMDQLLVVKPYLLRRMTMIATTKIVDPV
jgi:hypothetical protein